MEKENDLWTEFRKEWTSPEPIDLILLQVLRCNPHVKASYNEELKVWDFYGKKGDKFERPLECSYENRHLILKNDDGTVSLVGIFHVS